MIEWLQLESAGIILKNAKVFAETISIILASIGGVVSVCLALVPYVQAKNKRLSDEDFSYLSQMCVRLSYIKKTLVYYKPDMIYSVLVRDGRQIEARRIPIVERMRDKLSNYASATLSFLSETRDQYPSAIGWSNALEKLIELLFILENLSNTTSGFFIWTANDEVSKRELEYDGYIRTLTTMIDMIRDRQGNLERRFFGGLLKRKAQSK